MKNKIIEILKENKYSCVALDENGVYYESVGIGVKPIITPMRDDKYFFKDKYVGDKIVGKAAALLLILSGAKYVYGLVMSKGAVEMLSKYGVDYSFGTLVDFIENRTKTGMCPLEECVKDCDDKDLAFDIIERKICELMSK